MQGLVFLAMLGLGVCFNVVELSNLVDSHWKARAEGDAAAFVALLAPGFSQTINGEVDDTPWTDEKYVRDLFNKVSFSLANPLTSVAPVGPNAVIVVMDWDVTFLDTFEFLNMGEWQQTYTFNDNGKLIKLSNICDGANVQKYSDMVSPQIVDYKPAFEALVSAFNTKNVNGVLSAFVPDEELDWRRNGQNDSFVWIRPRFLGFLFQQSLTLKLDSFASSVPRTSYAAMTWTHTSKHDKVTLIPDSWFVTWNPDGKISHVRSITNGQEAILYAHIIPVVTEALSPQSKDELRKMYQAGSVSSDQLRKHLDL
jgi:hypothetical protein